MQRVCLKAADSIVFYFRRFRAQILYSGISLEARALMPANRQGVS